MHLSIEVATISFATTHVRSQGPSTVGWVGEKGGHEESIYDLRDDSPLLSFGTRSLDSFASASTPKIKRSPRL